ncbi:RNA-binding S4 domain-containing protein [Sphingomonas sp.]|jgi:ribosome-associated heat shock protein Hsp15|uniref:RNA-binding S4 domain-containing protein n=1 Tax=Sphingomonas sp. TaxID=28214 RepID=UPI002EDA9836
MAEGETMRVDRFLWHVRLAKTRSAAQAIAEKGTLRLDGRRIERSSSPVRVGSVLAFPLYGQVRVIRIEALPRRRGPPVEARTCYQDLTTAPGPPAANVSQEATPD